MPEADTYLKLELSREEAKARIDKLLAELGWDGQPTAALLADLERLEKAKGAAPVNGEAGAPHDDR